MMRLHTAAFAAFLGISAGWCSAQTMPAASDGAAEGLTQLVPRCKGASSRIGHYVPQRLELSDQKPESLVKPPADLAAPLYGMLHFGGSAEKELSPIIVIVDEPEGKDARLFIDANRNGDLSDDAPAEWAGKMSEDKSRIVMHQGGASIELGGADKSYPAHLSMYRFDKNDPGRAQLKNILLYYRDYAYEGPLTLGDRKFQCLLTDERATGDFRGDADADDSGVQLLVDVNGNGLYDKRGESFDVRKPFNIGGTTWEIADMRPDGGSFRIVKSRQTVPEIPTAPDHKVGNRITAFDAKDMEGRQIRFPGDYKGKIVMLDFWATWCGPCMGEVPGLVKAHEALHDQGFEVLGVTLDKTNAEAAIRKVTADKHMTWPQIYDGGYWKARLADLYVITSIPTAYLVDGDTGEILAAGQSLRGSALLPTLESALEKKKNAHQ